MGHRAKDETGLRFAPIPLRLAELRRAHGDMSQLALGLEIGYSDATITRVENGTQNWNQEFLQRCADFFNVDIFEIFELTPGSFLERYYSLSPQDRARVAGYIDSIKASAAA